MLFKEGWRDRIPGPFGGGCGPEGSREAHWYPDVVKDACGEHDECYDDCSDNCELDLGLAGCKVTCDLRLFSKFPLYGLATMIGGDETYSGLLEDKGCLDGCGD